MKIFHNARAHVVFIHLTDKKAIFLQTVRAPRAQRGYDGGERTSDSLLLESARRGDASAILWLNVVGATGGLAEGHGVGAGFPTKSRLDPRDWIRRVR
jgi:hypothetical protein